MSDSALAALLFLQIAIILAVCRGVGMLARIITERGISGTAVGSLALAAGAMDDAAAWIILTIVLSSFIGNETIAVAAAGGAMATDRVP